jgi:hypothetical protein
MIKAGRLLRLTEARLAWDMGIALHVPIIVTLAKKCSPGCEIATRIADYREKQHFRSRAGHGLTAFFFSHFHGPLTQTECNCLASLTLSL